MDILKPDYYTDFSCSADGCSYTCCQEWTIAVDEESMGEWKTRKIPAAVEGAGGFTGKTHLSDMVKKSRDGYVIDMGKNGICPFLNGEKLCNVVLEYGEDMISHTCHTFPRKCQKFEKHLEYSLDPGCPEVLELLWKRKNFLLKKEEAENLIGVMKELEMAAAETGEENTLLFLIREKSMELIAREDIPLTSAWIMLFGLLLDFYEKGDQITEEYVGAMFSDDVLQKLKETVLRAGRDPIDHFTERNELFLDISENYRKKKLYDSVLTDLTDRAHWFELTDDQYTNEASQEFEKNVWTELEHGVRNLMVEELYAGMLLPGGSLYTMVLKAEWLALVLTCIRHGLFLRWEIDEVPDEKKAKEIIVVLLRMTGYSEADIEEYLETTFRDPVWEWGYMALIL